jgi:hypothetical protein
MLECLSRACLGKPSCFPNRKFQLQSFFLSFFLLLTPIQSKSFVGLSRKASALAKPLVLMRVSHSGYLEQPLTVVIAASKPLWLMTFRLWASVTAANARSTACAQCSKKPETWRYASSGGRARQHLYQQPYAKHAFPRQLFLCLSRGCLGKHIVFGIQWRQKRRFSYQS